MRRIITVCLILAAVTVAAYLPVFHNGFVNYDDPSYVTENPHVLKGANWTNLLWVFKTNHAGNWHPLTWLSHMTDVSFFGLQPTGHHLTSVLFHTVNTLLLFLLLRSLTGAFWRSSIVAALFALHPIHVESVAWVAERKDVLSTCFLMLTLLAYTRYVRATKRPAKISVQMSWYSLAALFFVCGLMSKPMLVTVPFVMLLLDFWPFGRLQPGSLHLQHAVGRGVFWEKIPFFALSTASCVVTFAVQRGAGAVNSLTAVPLELRLANVVISYVRYLSKTLWPESLTVFYPLPREWPLEWAIAAIVFLGALTGVAFFRRRKEPYLLMGWLWYLGTLVPVVGFVQVGQQAIADRYTYIPLIGIFIMIVWHLGEIAAHRPGIRVWLAAGGALVIAGCGFDTWRQSEYWRDTRALFEHAVSVTRDNFVAHNVLGVELMRAGDMPAAERHLIESVRLRPRYPEALENLALYRERTGQSQAAVELLLQALESRPSAGAHYNVANLLLQQGKYMEAEEHYQSAVRLDPELTEAWINLGSLRSRQGRTDEARDNFAHALRLDSAKAADTHLKLGALLAGQKQFEAAIAEFQAALRAAPTNADIYFNLGSALQATSDFAGAATQFAEACRLRPEDLEARQALGFALLCQGKMGEAAPQFEQVLQSRPEPPAHYFLALALDAQGKAQPAAEHYREAIRLAPNSVAYLNDLAWLLATTPDDSVRNGPEAVRLAEEAVRISGDREPRFWGTLDTAYAESGRFDDAIRTATKTRELAIAAQQPDIAQSAEQRLALYHQHKPARNMPSPATPK